MLELPSNGDDNSVAAGEMVGIVLEIVLCPKQSTHVPVVEGGVTYPCIIGSPVSGSISLSTQFGHGVAEAVSTSVQSVSVLVLCIGIEIEVELPGEEFKAIIGVVFGDGRKS